MVAKEARGMVVKGTLLVLVTGSALAVEPTALLTGPHAGEQNFVPAMVVFAIVVREEKEAKARAGYSSPSALQYSARAS